MLATAQGAQGEYIFLPQEKVIYGVGSLARLPAETDRMACRRALVVTGRTLATQTPLIGAVESLLGARHAGTYADIRQHVPESGIAEATRLAREVQADLLVSVGGGSPIDAAKAIARALAGPDGAFVPHIAVPTTLSAAEFSHVAGFTDEATKSKTGFADPRATPRVVILDPEMTVATPMWLWLASGIRALDHAVETLHSPGDHPVNDVLALQAIRGLFEFLPRSKAEPDNLDARQQCQLAAWMSYFGPASVSAHSGLSHTLGKRIGATYDVPHGVTSCIILAHVMRYKAANEADAARLAPMARALNLVAAQASDQEAALAAADAVAGLVRQLELPSRLRDVDVPKDALESVARSTIGDSPHMAEVVEILRRAW
ncbi:MAG TPA: iron-containing alcohol dehydrogenase [Anaerolineae bacterium]|nr:iron-containing alcohol dehydrogenase [Anaerolineae bacterium]